MIPPLPTDNLYKFLALFEFVLVVFATYFPREKSAQARAQANEAQRAHKLANIQIARKQAQTESALAQIEHKTEELEKNAKLLIDSEDALQAKTELKAKGQSQALESELQALTERVKQHHENADKNERELARIKAQKAGLEDEISTAKVNAEADATTVNEAKRQADSWNRVSRVCAKIGWIVIAVGFACWYVLVQFHQDAMLRKQARDIKKPTGEPTNEKRA
jgi:SMC interacting uncharacterized protein involved in chromosome segregation